VQLSALMTASSLGSFFLGVCFMSAQICCPVRLDCYDFPWSSIGGFVSGQHSEFGKETHSL
jgi:hypothetical protein